MRHGIAGNKLNRNQSLRKATVRDIAKATLIKQRICTTKAKAKEARKLVDKLITLGKKGKLADKRRAFAVLCNHKLVSDLFNKIAGRFEKRNGGYTRIIPCGIRRGDNAELVFLELTEKEEIIVSKPKVKSKIKGKTKTVSDDVTVKDSSKGTSQKEVADVKKEKKHSKEIQKTGDKSAVKTQENDKKGKKFVSGLRKMFNRKSPEK